MKIKTSLKRSVERRLAVKRALQEKIRGKETETKKPPKGGNNKSSDETESN